MSKARRKDRGKADRAPDSSAGIDAGKVVRFWQLDQTYERIPEISTAATMLSASPNDVRFAPDTPGICAAS